uniref:Uncharacterized protein n=1 Tax=Tetraselmis chuii TaxID=63592 RepID=A0A7S1SX24_9CHLO|mmetsp:Transcript_33787/g.60362  ORF Transcript_33787/g.60362 Transcript_33787/m.60362 type:complete len:135 (+) Transcript_33787:247-651(+)|eukprot:CAMPEP_0177773254 /NCGR_PEP_ID=MMETSP0491_2-20121128/12733_1 /TAXON_ID=63592 /ORGANISM="Tetraselmis chuii, Strain PLY429" /LENGTH=134 /DNA_ID=CAMNT_0019291269 /DNA_START=235 /DNA_END=639 /DNA_ORIENTATION=-
MPQQQEQLATPESKVLEHMMETGVFDDLRLKILKEMKETKSLKEIASKRVAEELKKGELKEKVAKLKSGGDGAAARVRLHKHVMEELRKRLEKEMMDVISDCTWKLMYSGSEIGNQIDAEVHAVFLSVVANELI